MKNSTKFLTKTAILAALASIIMYIEFPLWFAPGFLKLDLSDIPALIAAFALGPIAGVAVELIKNLFHLFKSGTGGVGELANLIIGILYVVPAGILYSMVKSRHNAVIGMLLGVFLATVGAGLINYYLLIPFYANVMHFPLNAIIGMGTAVNNNIKDTYTLILYGVTPFNITKYLLASVLSYFIYKRLQFILEK